MSVQKPQQFYQLQQASISFGSPRLSKGRQQQAINSLTAVQAESWLQVICLQLLALHQTCLTGRLLQTAYCDRQKQTHNCWTEGLSGLRGGQSMTLQV
jgi:hypothetical protein